MDYIIHTHTQALLLPPQRGFLGTMIIQKGYVIYNYN